MRMRQETFKKSYYIPAFGKSIEIRRNQDIDEDGILGKELLAQYGEDCILEGETKSLMEKVVSGEIGGSGTSLTTEQIAALGKIEGLQSSASEIDNMVTNGATQADLDTLALSTGNLTASQVTTIDNLSGLTSDAEKIDSVVDRILSPLEVKDRYEQTVGLQNVLSDAMSYSAKKGHLFTTDSKFVATNNGEVLEAKAILTEWSAAMYVYFFGVRPTETGYKITWVSEKIFTTSTTVTWTPDLKDRPTVEAGDFYGITSTANVKLLGSNNQANTKVFWYPNATTPLAVDTVVTSTTPTWYNDANTNTSGHFPLIQMKYRDLTNNVDTSISNISNGYIKLDSNSRMDSLNLPDSLNANTIYVGDYDILSETTFDPTLNKDILTFTKDTEIVKYKSFDPITTLNTSTTTFGHNRIMIPFDTAKNLISKDGILRRIRLFPGGAIVSGYESTAKIQIWIVRASNSLTDKHINFKKVSFVGEVDATDITKYKELNNLTVAVKEGDLIAYKGIGVGIPYGAGGLEYPTTYMAFVPSTVDSESSLQDGILISPGSSRAGIVGVEYDIVPNNFLTSNLNIPYLDSDRKVPVKNMSHNVSKLYNKNILVVGTSITATSSASIPGFIARMATITECKLNQQALGSSFICISVNAGYYGLSETIAEIQAKALNYTTSGGSSYEYRMLGANLYDSRTGTPVYWQRFNKPDFFIFDHGHNDQSYPLGTIDSMDRSTYYGAANFIISKLREEAPDVRIVFMTPFSLYSGASSPNYNERPGLVTIREANIALAKKYKAPLCDFSYLLGMDKFTHPLHHDGTGGWGAHPQTDVSQQRAADVLSAFLLSL